MTKLNPSMPPFKVNGYNVLAATKCAEPDTWLVLVHRPGAFDGFVVWSYRASTDEAFWGHYLPTLPEAIARYEAKGGTFAPMVLYVGD